MPISALDRPVPPPANSATFPRSKLLPATDQDVTPENSFSKQALVHLPPGSHSKK